MERISAMTTMATRLVRNIGRHFAVRSFFSAGSGDSIATRGMAIAPPAGSRYYQSGVAPPKARNALPMTSGNCLLFGATGALIGSLFLSSIKGIADLEVRVEVLEHEVKKLEEEFEKLRNLEVIREREGEGKDDAERQIKGQIEDSNVVAQVV